jgi:hypothetical protein
LILPRLARHLQQLFLPPLAWVWVHFFVDCDSSIDVSTLVLGFLSDSVWVSLCR